MIVIVSELREKDSSLLINGFVCNISTRDNISKFHNQIKEKNNKPIDILINNAGVVIGKPLSSLTEKEIRRTMDVNLLGQFWTCQEFLPNMIERKSGTIVTIASTMGFFSAVALSDYCASKHAVIGFHNAIKLEMKKLNSNIDFSLICPNAINTGMFDGITTGMSWLIPILEPMSVAKATVDAIKKKQVEGILLINC